MAKLMVLFLGVLRRLWTAETRIGVTYLISISFTNVTYLFITIVVYVVVVVNTISRHLIIETSKLGGPILKNYFKLTVKVGIDFYC